jgi:Kef-type K+ transport system membrane component KefB
VSTVIIRAGIIGPIAVGIIYGAPLANILEHNWQETFLAIGYVGLILIIFEGGLTTRMDLLKQNFSLSMLAATTGVVFPIGLSYILLHLGFGFGSVETVIIGSAAPQSPSTCPRPASEPSWSAPLSSTTCPGS